MSDVRITGVRARSLGLPAVESTGPADEPWLCTPVSHFADARERRGAYYGPVVVTVVEVETDAGITGVGTCGVGNAGTAAVVRDNLAPLIVGDDPFAVEHLWSKMYRSSARYGRRGVAVAALSGIDIALWDIMGKVLGVPAYDLLGGMSKPDGVTAYVSRLYALKDLDELADEARHWKALGFRMMKQRFGFGPQHGTAGMRANVELVRTVREAVGDEVDLAGDAYMGWDVEYALEMERMLRPFGLRWIEEPLMPHDVRGYARLCRHSQTPISHGEHCFTRYDFQELIEADAAHILQPDVNRVGGFTEARKVFALGAARDLPVVPHGNDLHNLHFVFSQLNCPFTEYFPDGVPEDANSLFWRLFEGNPRAEGGTLRLGADPGIGYVLNEELAAELTLPHL